MLEACEFLRVRHDTNGLNPLCLHFNGQHEIGSISVAKDQRQLTIDFSQLNTGASAVMRTFSFISNKISMMERYD